MRKTIITMLLSAAVCGFLLTGCGDSSKQAGNEAEITEVSAPEAEEPAEDEETDVEGDAGASEEPEAEDENGKKESHYQFQAHVYPSYMDELMGPKIHEAYDNYIDAVLNGEDEFDCPDAHTYDWMMGQCAYACFPVIAEYTESGYADGWSDGKGKINYKLPKEEVQQKIEEFKDIVEGILNEALEDDYSDFEKALALYLYFDDHYTYDYYAMENYSVDQVSGYRALTEQQGICQEFSIAYSYLLLQVGVDATVMSGASADGMLHQWSYVTIGGKHYLVDPTYELGTGNSLAYFLMDDEQRTREDGYVPADCTLCNHYGTEKDPDFSRDPSYDCTDKTYEELWDGYFVSFDHGTKKLTFRTFGGDEDGLEKVFDYGALE